MDTEHTTQPPPPPHPHTSSSPTEVVDRLRQSLSSCSKVIHAGGDLLNSEQPLLDLLLLLNSISHSIIVSTEPENQDLEDASFQILTEIQLLLYSSSSSLDQQQQAVIDALSFELPKAAARLGCASPRCMHISESIVHSFTHRCTSPRDMLSVLCEAIGSPEEMFRVPSYYAPLLSGFPKVFVSIRRRQFEQVKAAAPVILNALKAIVLDSDDEDTDPGDVFHTAICVADSVKAVCLELEGKDNVKLRALLGLFVLQITALASIGMGSHSSPLMLKLSHFLQYCGLSYLGLIMGTDAEKLLEVVVGDGGDDMVGCFSHIRLGAAITVIWGYKSNEVALAAEADLASLKCELQSSRNKRWYAVGMLKHILMCINLSWELKKDTINFLVSIMDAKLSQSSDDEDEDYSTYMPSLYSSLQAIQLVIMYATEIILRKNAFAAFKKILADTPTSLRFDILKALIRNGDSSSMIAVLLDCVKEELRIETGQRSQSASKVSKAEREGSQGSCFWSSSVLELVELVLRPPGGGPPSLPEYSDAVLSALNLYRFILITELTGKTNNTGVLSKDKLQKAYGEWLLPLRTLVTGVMAETQKDRGQLASDILCGLNPVEVVLYRCIELVEPHL